jgi:D-glycero-D-manno-heptose 1,7-bisphosphate phosphatase
MAQKAVFLDRDGVLNWTRVEAGKPYAPTRFEDFRLLDEALLATKVLKEAGFLLIVVTNQPDVGNGFVARGVVEKMNEYMCSILPLDEVKVCYHAQTDGCNCRKPKPGMLLDAITTYQIDASISYMVGDRGGDILAGKAAGCQTIFLERGYRESVKDKADFHCQSLTEATAYILNSTRTNS